MTSGQHFWRDRLPHPLWLGMTAGVVIGALLTLGGVAIVRHSDDDPLGPSGTMVMLSGDDDSPNQERHALKDLWNALYPNHKVELHEVKQGTRGQFAQMVNEAADIYNLDVIWTPKLVEGGYLRPLDMSRLPKGFLGGFLEKPLSTGRYRGTQWALPFNTNVGLMFYRSDLVTPPKNVKGVPQIDWQTVQQAARGLPALQQKDPNIAAAYTSQLQDNEGLTVNGFEAIWAAGGDIVDQSGRIRFDPTVWQAGLTRLAIPRVDSQGPDLVLRGSENLDEVLSRDRFGSGRTVFMRNWPIEYGNLLAANPKFPVGVALLPGPSALGGADLAIAKHSRYPRAAQALIQFLTADSSQRLLMERGGYAATRTSVYDDPAVQQKLPDLSVIKEAIAEARMRPVTPFYDRFSKVFSEAASAAIRLGGALDPRLGDDLTKALQGR